MIGHLANHVARASVPRIDFSVFSHSMVQAVFMIGYAVAFLWGVFGLQKGIVTFRMMATFLQLV